MPKGRPKLSRDIAAIRMRSFMKDEPILTFLRSCREKSGSKTNSLDDKRAAARRFRKGVRTIETIIGRWPNESTQARAVLDIQQDLLRTQFREFQDNAAAALSIIRRWLRPREIDDLGNADWNLVLELALLRRLHAKARKSTQRK